MVLEQCEGSVMSLFGLCRGREGEKRARRVTAGALFNLEGSEGGVFVKEWLVVRIGWSVGCG